jgi:prophage regulatory protein
MAEQFRTFLRLKQVKAAIGMSRSWIYEAIRGGDFIAVIPLAARAVAWPADEVAKLNAARIAGKTDEEIRELVIQLEAAQKGGAL